MNVTRKLSSLDRDTLRTGWSKKIGTIFERLSLTKY